MAELAVVGAEDFLVGFELAGVRKTFKIGEDARATLDAVMKDPDVGILVVSESTVKTLPEHVQRELSRSTKPVVVVLSHEQEQSQLRKDIIRAIGVDLWKSE